MNQMKKVLYGLAVVAGLGLLGASNAHAQCATVSSTAYALRTEGSTEQAGTITLTCGAGTLGGAANPGIISVVLSGSVKVDNAVGTSSATLGAAAPGWVNTCSAPAGAPSTPDNKSYFACPALGSTAVPVTPPTVTTSTTSAVFEFTPTAGAQTLTIAGIRLNVGAAALPTGSVVTATVVTSGGIGSKSNSSIVLGIVSPTLASTTAFQTTALSILSCAPAAIPTGAPTAFNVGVTTGPGTLDASGANTLVATVSEGTLGIWETLAQITAPGNTNGFPTDTAATQGIRFRIQLTGVPTGVVAYVPEVVDGSAAAGGVYYLVTGENPDGSGGAILTPTSAAAFTANQNGNTYYDSRTAVGGTITIDYEVQTAPAATVLDSFAVRILLAGTSPVGFGAVTGQISPSPVGPPVATAAIPQFVAATKSTVANVSACVSYLLFPWVVNTNDGNYNTGLAIANTTSDVPDQTATVGQTGTVTAYFFPFDGSASFSQVLASSAKAGTTTTFVVSSLNKAFSGYVIVECSFSLAHGFAFIDNPIAGQNGFAEGYLGISLTNPRIGANLNAFESRGN